MKSLFSAIALVALSAGTSQAGDCKVASCAPCPQPACATQAVCAWEEVERTVDVSEWGTETRKVCVTEYQRQERDRKVTVYENVCKHEVVKRDVTYYVNEPHSRDEKFTVCKPVWRDVDYKYTVCVPTRETKKGTRLVCKPNWTEIDQEYTVMVPCVEKHTQKVCSWQAVPVTKTYKVCEDQGHWETREVPVCNTGCNTCYNGCNTCNTCAPVACAPVTCTQKVWVPNVVEKDVEYTCNEWQRVEEDREYEVTVCKPTVQHRKVKVCNWVQSEEEYEYVVCGTAYEEKTGSRKVCEMIHSEEVRTVNYTVCVPKTKTVEETVSHWECIPTDKIVKEIVCVPVTVEKDVQVPVCRTVQKTIKVKVPVYVAPQPCNTCSPGPVCHTCSPAPVCNSCCN